MRIIFLDIDGVLNYLPNDPRKSVPNFVPCDERCYGLNPEKVEYLRQILDYTGAKLVISSSWRHFHDYSPYQPNRDWRDVLAEMMGKKSDDIIIGETPSLFAWTMDNNGESEYTLRGMEIRKWIEENSYAKSDDVAYCVLDDEVLDITTVINDRFVVQTDRRKGLTVDDAYKVSQILLNQPEEDIFIKG